MKSKKGVVFISSFLLVAFVEIFPVVACPPGDLDGDCAVNLTDLILFAEQWLAPAGCVGYNNDNCADLVGNDGVNQNDLAIIAAEWGVHESISIVINEIHYHPDNNTEQVEFIELYNTGTEPVNLNGCYFEGAIGYTFSSIPLMNPNTYVVVCQNAADFSRKFGITALGPFEGKLNNDGEQLLLRAANGNIIDEVNYGSDFPWPVAANGEGASMELINPSLDNDLAGSWRSSGFNVNTRPELSFGTPTPGTSNSVYTVNAPPQIRHVRHTPNQPLSDEVITFTAKITDPQGVKKVWLKYQIVSPGSYIPAYLPITHNALVYNPYQSQPFNPDFESGWNTLAMGDAGTGSDAMAGDDIYTITLSKQNNRSLIRYRIIAWDNSDAVVQTPYADDSSLNFACYVYDGVADFVVDGDTSVHPDAQAGSSYTYNAEMLTSIPVYTLITRAEDLYECNGYNDADQIPQGGANTTVAQDAGRAYNWEGAFVYEGKVYDHIAYRLRGGNGRYNNGAAGKRSMKFRFNRGSYFQARDIYGKKFPFKWQHLNTGKMFGNKIILESYRHYPYGMNEVINMQLFDLADVPAAHTYWMHFRTVTGVKEAPNTSGGQYQGDFGGLYIAFENYDGAFLKRLGLPKGNLYKLSALVYDGARQLRYQSENAVNDASDYENIRWNLNHEASADFIRKYLDCDEWYRYHTVTEAIRHFDVFSGPACGNCMKNMAWYFSPDYTGNSYGKLQFLPFDIDDTWGPYWNKGIDHGKAAIYDQLFADGETHYVKDPEKSPLKQEYRNYMREFRDLLWQPEVIDSMIAELASVIADIVPADRDRWKADPTPGSPIDNGTLEEGVAIMEQFAWTRGGFPPDSRYYWVGSSNQLDNLANGESDGTNIPNKPTITYTGTAGYPENDLNFLTSDFSDPQGNDTFAAMKWRIAEVEPSVGTPAIETVSLLNPLMTWKYFKGTKQPPANWNQNGFNDASWSSGQTSIGYTDGDDNTILSDMRYNYTSVYLRNTFTVTDAMQVAALRLHVYIDDGCIIYINGNEVARLHCSSGAKAYNSVTETTHHEADWETGNYEKVTLTIPYNYLVNGTNVIAVHGLQELITSTDFSFDVSITADLGELPPTQTATLSKKKYEINALWESDDLTTFAATQRISADGVTAGKTYRVRCKMKDTTGRWSHWSAPIEFVAGIPVGTDLRDHLRVTEVMYNNGDAEFIELQNTGLTTLNLADVSFTNGIKFTFDGSLIESLAAGEFVLVVKDQAAFESQYGAGYNGLIAGQFTSGSLSNSGEVLKLEDAWDGTIVEFEYNDGRGWPITADGAGHSLVTLPAAIDPSQPLRVLNFSGNWRQSTYIGGSPGFTDPTLPTGVVINEFMSHTDFHDPINFPDYDSNDWIELYNAGSSAVNLNDNWYLSDDMGNLKKWALPDSSLSSGNRISYDEITGFHSPITTGFGLNKTGEQIFLSYLPGVAGINRVVDCISFKGQENSVSMGRYPDGGDFWFHMNPGTRDITNNNAVPHVVISEFMYHPTDGMGNAEYVEVFNPTGVAVSLRTVLPLAGSRGWALDGAVTYEFPAGTPNLAAGGQVLIVGFDPADFVLLAAFETAYGTGTLTAGVDIFGPWGGDLSNGGERLTLEKPQDSDDPLNPLMLSWIIVDECIYNDSWPWPSESDGTGLALHRASTSAAASGNNPSNWIADIPDPGQLIIR